MTSLKLTINEKSYDITPPFTNRELHVIKQISGVRAGELFQSLEAGDTDLIVALAHIGVRRNGTARPSLDELWDMEAGAIGVEIPEELDAADSDPTVAADAAATNGNQATTPHDSGPLSSDTSSDSPLATSVI